MCRALRLATASVTAAPMRAVRDGPSPAKRCESAGTVPRLARPSRRAHARAASPRRTRARRASVRAPSSTTTVPRQTPLRSLVARATRARYAPSRARLTGGCSSATRATPRSTRSPLLPTEAIVELAHQHEHAVRIGVHLPHRRPIAASNSSTLRSSVEVQKSASERDITALMTGSPAGVTWIPDNISSSLMNTNNNQIFTVVFRPASRELPHCRT